MTIPGWSSDGPRVWVGSPDAGLGARAQPFAWGVPLTARELLVAVGALAAAGAAIFGQHVVSGGFVSDDWGWASLYSARAEYGGAFEAFETGSRPLLGLYFLATHAILGMHVHLQLAFQAALGIAVATSFHALLRLLGVPRVGAFACALIALAFPASDSVRLWSAQVVNAALLVCLWSLCLWVLALRARTTTRRLALALGSVALYLASVLAYELTVPAVLVALGLFVRGRSRAQAAAAIGATAALGGAAIWWVRDHTPYPISGPGTAARHAWTIAQQASDLLASVLAPWGSPRAVGLLLALALAVAGLTSWRTARWPATRRWLGLGSSGLAVVVVGYLAIVPAEAVWYSPANPGEGNRVNAAATFGFAMTGVGLLGAAAVSLGSAPVRRRWAASAAIGSALGIAGVMAHRTFEDGRAWSRSWEIQRDVLGVVRSALPSVPSGTTIYVGGQPIFVEDGIPVFRYHWDLDGAVQVLYRDSSVSGFAIFPGMGFECGAEGLHPTGYIYGPDQTSAYGTVALVQYPSGAVRWITDRETCATQATAEWAGPYNLSVPGPPRGVWG